MRFTCPFEVIVDYQFWRYDKWFSAFAWYPVKVKDKWVWLEPVERCRREGCFSDYRYPGDRTPTEYERLKFADNLEEVTRLRDKKEYKYDG